MRKIKGYLDEWRVQEYLLITFFISWFCWGILILLTALQVVEFTHPVSLVLFAIGGFGPTISALMCLDGKVTVKRALNFIFQHKRRTIGYLIIFILLTIIIIGASSRELNPTLPLVALPITFLVCTFVGGGNEELGWRGTLQPILNQVISKKVKRPALSFALTSLCVGAIWTVWHIPLWFVNGSTQQNIPFGWFAVLTITLAFWLGFLYYKTNSVFYCMLIHGLSNTMLSLFVINITAGVIIAVCYVVIALLTVLAVACSKKRSDSANLPRP